MSAPSSEALAPLAAACPGLEIAASFRVQGSELDAAAINADADLSIASAGKLLLLIEAARQIEAGALDPAEPLSRERFDPVADSGLWQHLAVNELPAGDLATMVASVSDNLATNVLLAKVGLDSVNETRVSLGLETTRMLDRVRDIRGPEMPESFARGSAAELSDLMDRLNRGSIVSAEVSRTVLAWLATNVDLSMVAAGFDLDPLAHSPEAGPLQLFNKTGQDIGVRAEAGLLRGPQQAIAYAVIVNWPPDGPPEPGAVAMALREVGTSLRLALAG